MSTAPERDPRKSFEGIELLRFLCAFTIIAWHYQHFFLIKDGIFLSSFAREKQPFAAALWFAYNWGNYAVEVFWSLSGFIFFWKYAQPIYDSRINAKAFFIFRFSRLYPLHLLTLIAVIGLQQVYSGSHGEPFVYSYNDLRHFALQLFLASDWGFHKGLSFNGPVWSISVEILAYAAFFLAARRWRLGGGRLAGIIVGLIIAKMALPWIKDIVLCLLYFFIGGVVHTLHGRFRSPHASLVALGLASLLLYANWATDGKVHTFTLIAITVALLFTFLWIGELIRHNGARASFVRLGSLTYSSYLLHFPLQIGAIIAIEHLGVGRDLFFHPAALIAFMIGTFAIAHTSFTLFEHPMQTWLRAKLAAPAMNAPDPAAAPPSLPAGP